MSDEKQKLIALLGQVKHTLTFYKEDETRVLLNSAIKEQRSKMLELTKNPNSQSVEESKKRLRVLTELRQIKNEMEDNFINQNTLELRDTIIVLKESIHSTKVAIKDISEFVKKVEKIGPWLEKIDKAINTAAKLFV